MGLVKPMAELSRDMSGIRRAIARDLRIGESFIVMQFLVLDVKYLVASRHILADLALKLYRRHNQTNDLCIHYLAAKVKSQFIPPQRL